MNEIRVLDPATIDKIAAGEVVERPASIVKELVENAIDAGADEITVEIEEGGIALIRVTDNGCGMEKDQIPRAFLRHATSKIDSAEDLSHLTSLGFRGEALSSIAAVAKVEVRTKTPEAPVGIRYEIAGGVPGETEEIGAKDGTTFFIRHLFYNTPARRKFLKTAMTEAGHIGDLMTRMALSHPKIAFRFINGGQTRLQTSGNGSIKDIIYHIYGREIASNLMEVCQEAGGMRIEGYIGKPLISRGNRNYETYFINHRYIKNGILSKAIEDAYKDFTMQHKYPFVVLHLAVDTQKVDVNVHPSKMEVRFSSHQEVYGTVFEALSKTLHEKELIPQVELETPPVGYPSRKQQPDKQEKRDTGSVAFAGFPSETEANGDAEKNDPKPSALAGGMPNASLPEKGGQKDLEYFLGKMRERVESYHRQNSAAEVGMLDQIFRPDAQVDRIREQVRYGREPSKSEEAETAEIAEKRETAGESPGKGTEEQLDFFGENLLKRETKAGYRLIGQAFDTYWMVEFQEQLYIIDQHAAHERVLYEQTMRQLKTRETCSQMIAPPIILTLDMQEAQVLESHLGQFEKVGFEIESFGQNSFAVRGVPANLSGIAKKELLLQMLDGLADEMERKISPELLEEKIASMSCKAAVKGHDRLSFQEADALMDQLLTLENPYHCPHGRPTLIAMSKRELEKKFKRIV